MAGKSGSGYLPTTSPGVVRAECDIAGLYVKRVVLAADGEGSMAILGARPTMAEDGSEIRVEDATTLAVGGREVKVWVETVQGQKTTIFHGWIMGLNPRAAGRNEDVEFTALGLEHGLRTEKIFGAYARDADDQATHFQASPCVFNPDGRPNKNKEDLTESDGSDKRVCFNLDATEENDDAERWNAAHMARYCATSERKTKQMGTGSRVFETSAQVGGELGGFTPFDVNVEGEDIWSALVRIASLCSHSVVLDFGETRQESTLRFFTRKLNDAKEVKQFEMPPAGGPVEISDHGRVLASVDYQADWASVVSRMDAVAPPKLYEYDFELKAGWKQEDEDAAFGTGSIGAKIAKFLKETDPELSSDWERFKWVGRRYILNETGRDDVKVDEGEPFDFSEVFSSEKYAHRLRPFRSQLVSQDDAGEPKPVALTVEWDAGGALSDNIVQGDLMTLLEDRAGVYFRGRPLVLVPRALDSGDTADLFPSVVRVRAVVEGDQASPKDVYASKFAMALRTFGLIRLDDGFRTDNVNDDAGITEKARALVDEAMQEHSQHSQVGTFVSPYITRQFRVGDVVDNIGGRGIPLKCVIMKISWDFMSQSTEFALQVPTLDTETHSRQKESLVGAGVDASTDRETREVGQLLAHKYLFGHPVDAQLSAAMDGIVARRGGLR